MRNNGSAPISLVWKTSSLATMIISHDFIELSCIIRICNLLNILKVRIMSKCKSCLKDQNTDNSDVRNKYPDRFHTYCKVCARNIAKSRARLLKQKCIDYKGGKCEICGYAKCNSALEFHHLDPSQKEFQLSNARKSKWEKTKSELDKCQLLCSNCHNEVHYDKIDLIIPPKKNLKSNICNECGTSIGRKLKRCSVCHKLNKTKNIPTYEELVLSIKELNSNYSAIGRKYNVSDNTIRKWVKKYNL